MTSIVFVLCLAQGLRFSVRARFSFAWFPQACSGSQRVFVIFRSFLVHCFVGGALFDLLCVVSVRGVLGTPLQFVIVSVAFV